MRKILILGLLLLSACALHKVSEEESLLEAVRSYWSAVAAGRWAEAYDYEYPLLKKTVAKEVYVSRRGNPLTRIVGFEVEGLEFEAPDRAVVSLRVSLRLFLPGVKKAAEFKVPLKDRWMKIGGRWYHVPSKRKKNFSNKEK